MKQPRQTRKERKAAKGGDALIMDVGGTVKKYAGNIVVALDAIADQNFKASDVVIVLTQDKMFVKGKEVCVAELKATNPLLAEAVERGLPCEHVLLLVSLQTGIQGCCPECDYDVRGRKLN